MEREMLDKLIEQEILIKELKQENFVLVSQLNVEQPDYKGRIEKAIEYIERGDYTNNLNYMDDGVGDIFKELLKILKGEDK